MNLADKKVLITGANRGIGRALLDEALRRGAPARKKGMGRTLENDEGCLRQGNKSDDNRSRRDEQGVSVFFKTTSEEAKGKNHE